MKKLLLLVVAMVLVFTMAGCKPEEKTLVIFQNKVEIDDVLRDYAEAWGLENGVTVEVKTCGGDTCAYGTQILAEFQADEQPDIFVIEGMGGFLDYEDKILDLTGEAWADITELEFAVEGVTYGFPVAVEGWGMAYNKDILTAAGVDPDGLTSQAAYETAFQAIQDYYDTDSGMSDYAVLSMAAASGMTWVTGLHNFNGYLSAGLDYDDSTIIDKLNNGEVDAPRLAEYADWVEILFNWGDEDILLTGTYDDQVGKFADGEAAFLHQGNWTDSSYGDSDFEMGYAPHAVMPTGNDSIFIGAPSFYVINKDSDAPEDAKAFLNDLAATAEGHDYMVNQAHMVPAFSTVTLVPSTPLSAAVLEWNNNGKAYAWWQNDMPSGFGMDVLGPIYELYAKGVKGDGSGIDKAEFIEQITAEIENLG
ncbi:MAG: extracellular solute-binding protein [Candidatus Izimaplasma sp.]|nr:extracellular solute-binding protein [Candidatus Izimaplasma bacterium]